jgi:hypothetical protein
MGVWVGQGNRSHVSNNLVMDCVCAGVLRVVVWFVRQSRWLDACGEISLQFVSACVCVECERPSLVELVAQDRRKPGRREKPRRAREELAHVRGKAES